MDKKEYLAHILGSVEKAEAFMKKTEAKKDALEQAGVESKEKVEETAPETPPVVEPAAPATNEQLVQQVLKEMDIEGLSEFVKNAQEAIEKVPVLEALVKDLQGSKEEALAEMIAPPAKLPWSRPSQSKETVLKDNEEDKALEKKTPGVPEGYWLSDVTGTQPLSQ